MRLIGTNIATTNLDQFRQEGLFFARELQKFDNLPPVLFVKACEVMNLFE